MKVYVVTTGAYSDYTIQKIFTNKEKAEEYKEWLYDSNDIEEYEIEDDLEVSKFYKITVSYEVHDTRITVPEVYIYKCTHDDVYSNSTYYGDYHNYYGKYFRIGIVRFIPEQNWNEEFYKNKYIKAIYDLAAIARYKRLEGASESDIQALFSNMRGDLDEQDENYSYS